MVKGVILAGGKGTRLFPLTKVTNKHLLPVYSKPMIYYPIEILKRAGIKDILIVSGRHHAGHFLELLGRGEDIGVNFSFTIQEEEGGIAEALALAEDFADNEKLVVVLGDNVFEDNILESVRNFESQGEGCKLFLKEVSMEEARRFGCAVVEEDIVSYVEEKPRDPRSNLAMTGLYMFDSRIFDIIRTLQPSARGEYEITDAIDKYVKEGKCYYSVVKGYWSDAGTFESLFNASKFVKESGYWDKM